MDSLRRLSRSLVAAGVALLLAMAAGGGVWALDPRKTIEQYPIDHWDTEHGLPQASVSVMLQSSDGYLWLGTQEGLVRFDGVSFKAYNRHNTAAFRNHMVRALLEDRSGTIWIGTDGGLVLMHDDPQRGKVFSSLTVDDGLVDNGVNVLYQGKAESDRAVWVGTDRGLTRITGDHFDSLTENEGLPHPAIRSFTENAAGRLWVATGGGGVVVLEGLSVAANITTADGLSNDEVLVVSADSTGGVWIGTRNGLCYWHDGRIRTFGVADGLAHGTVWAVLEDNQSRLWVGTSGGLNRLEGDRLSLLTQKQGLSCNFVWSLLEDREGSIWVGTSNRGLNRLRDSKVITVTERDGLTANSVWTVLEDRHGVLWIGTNGGGLNRLDEHGVTALTVDDGLLDDEVMGLCEAGSGDLWVGTRAGLNLVRDGQVVSYPSEQGPLLGDIQAVLEDRQGTLWIGTDEDGLIRYDGASFRSFSVAEGLPDNRVLCLTETSLGELWIGTAGGVSRFQDGTFQSLTREHGMPGGWVTTILEDPNGVLWFGTSHGLARLEKERVSSFTMAHGLYDEMIYQILEDDLGNLWMSCNKGVFRVAKQELEEVAEGLRNQVTSVSLSKSDGMVSRECNGGYQPAGCRTRDGRLWFPTIQGIAVIDPAEIPTNDVAPPVTIEQMLVDGAPVPLQGLPSCAPGSRRFEITYTALSFIASERLRFQYRLEPYDEAWIETVGRRTAYYTGIPPGSYRFQVRAANADGVWSQRTASLDFRVRPYFYQTDWFIGACLVMLLCIAWSVYRARIRRVEDRYRAVLNERQRMARELHDTLAQGLTAMSLQLEGIDETIGVDYSAARDHLDMARQIISTSLADARRTVWNLRSQVLDDSSLDAALVQVAEQLTAGTAITTSVEMNGSGRSIAKETEGQLLRIGQEAITNAVRHASCSHIVISVTFQAGLVSLRVTDDGKGFHPDEREGDDHLGLRGMTERAAALGGRLEVTSRPGIGTVVEVIVPSAPAARLLAMAALYRSRISDRGARGEIPS